MFKKIITGVTLICFILYLYGCYSTSEIPKEEIPTLTDPTIKSVVTEKGVVYDFVDDQTYKHAYLIDSLIVGWIKLDTYPVTLRKVEIPISEVKSVFVNYRTTSNSCLTVGWITLGLVAAAYLAFAIIWEKITN